MNRYLANFVYHKGVAVRLQLLPVLSTGYNKNVRNITMWTKPTVTDIRLGFEITMYCYNR